MKNTIKSSDNLIKQQLMKYNIPAEVLNLYETELKRLGVQLIESNYPMFNNYQKTNSLMKRKTKTYNQKVLDNLSDSLQHASFISEVDPVLYTIALVQRFGHSLTNTSFQFSRKRFDTHFNNPFVSEKKYDRIWELASLAVNKIESNDNKNGNRYSDWVLFNSIEKLYQEGEINEKKYSENYISLIASWKLLEIYNMYKKEDIQIQFSTKQFDKVENYWKRNCYVFHTVKQPILLSLKIATILTIFRQFDNLDPKEMTLNCSDKDLSNALKIANIAISHSE